jgi:hypothetical protein
VAMLKEERRNSPEILKSLTRLDLYLHSLRLAGEKLVLQAGEAGSGDADDLLEKSLQLANDCSGVIHGLEHLLDEPDLGPWESAVNRVDLAIRRASGAGTLTLRLVNIWRVVEATDEFVSSVAQKYGYTRLMGDSGLDAAESEETKGAELTRLFEEYGNAMAARPEAASSAAPPFEFGILRWRGSQLFYVQRVEDGARWIELDPDYEPQTVGEEPDASESVQARTIEGHQIELRLDLETDDDEVADYVRSQRGNEYYVSGYQVITEKGPNRRQQRRRG